MSNKDGFLPIPPSRPYPARIPSRDISLMASIFLTVFHFHFHQLLLSVGHRLSCRLSSPEIHSSVTWCRVRSRLGWENNLCISISLVRSIVCILSSKLLPITIFSTRIFNCLKKIFKQKHIFQLLVVPLITFNEMLVQSKKDPHQFPQPHCSGSTWGKAPQ